MRLLLTLILLASTARADAWLGLMLGDGAHGGARVKEALANSPGEKAGIAAGDEVLAIDGAATPTPQSLIDAIRQAGVGKQVKLKLVDAKGKSRSVSVKLESKPDMVTLQRSTLMGRPAPDFDAAAQAGAKLGKISSLKGKVVLIDFFATWCGPCVVAMPHLEEMHQKLGPKGLTVIGVSTETAAIVAGAAKKYNLSYSLVSDEKEGISGSYHVFALPTAILIDKKGVVREVAVNDEEAIDMAVQRALK